ncbi:MAG: DUF362 domain-containing protein [Clostridiales bacterium]|nr:DUF362 domain-containing protein [Clostridiales bacterium]
MKKSEVYLVAAEDRGAGARRCLKHFPLPDYTNKTVYVKPNFNTADPSPGSTHVDTLDALLEGVRAANAKKIVVGERSGPAVTAEVFEAKGLAALCGKYGAEVLNFETMPEAGWITVDRPGFHWPGGLQIPRAVLDADASVATCCLKTHGFGGVFSCSLKLAVGLTPEDFHLLHDGPDMRKMIAEINVAYTPDLVIADAVEVFTDGGPMEGKRYRANLMLAGSDRIALDAVGLAVLKSVGSNSAIMDTPIFAQEQIVRAVELGLGAAGPSEIEIVTDDEASAQIAARVGEILQKG